MTKLFLKLVDFFTGWKKSAPKTRELSYADFDIWLAGHDPDDVVCKERPNDGALMCPLETFLGPTALVGYEQYRVGDGPDQSLPGWAVMFVNSFDRACMRTMATAQLTRVVLHSSVFGAAA